MWSCRLSFRDGRSALRGTFVAPQLSYQYMKMWQYFEPLMFMHGGLFLFFLWREKLAVQVCAKSLLAVLCGRKPVILKRMWTLKRCRASTPDSH